MKKKQRRYSSNNKSTTSHTKSLIANDQCDHHGDRNSSNDNDDDRNRKSELTSTTGDSNGPIDQAYDIDGRSRLRLEFYPFAYALYDSELSIRCWYCLAKPASLKRCVGCQKAEFCNKSCQKLGWKDHRVECRALKQQQIVASFEVRFLGRIVTRYKDIKSGKDKEDCDFYRDRSSKRTIMEICSHTDLIREDPMAMKKFRNIYEDLLKFYGIKALVSKEEVYELHCRNYINRHAISDAGYVEEIGKGLYLDLCAYNHSCRPNTVFTCDGFIATLRALHPNVNITDRSTTFYTYIDLLSSTQERKKQLKDTWYFDCHCERCDDQNDAIISSILCPNCKNERERLCIFGNWPYKDPKTQIIVCPKCHEQVSREYVFEAISAMRFVQRIASSQEIDQMSREQAVNFLSDLKQRYAEILPPINVYFCKIIQMLIPLIDVTDYKQLLELHLQAEECVRFCFPYNHPAVALHYRSIATFYLRCGHPHRSMLYYKKAAEIFMFTLDDSHPMTMDNKAMLEDALLEIVNIKKLMLGDRLKESCECNQSQMVI